MNSGERQAARHYRLRGYRLLDANIRVGRYELDLVLRRGRTIVFCEVKRKSTLRHGNPAEMVNAEKRRRVRTAAAGWLARHPEYSGFGVRHEVVAITGRKLARLPDLHF